MALSEEQTELVLQQYQSLLVADLLCDDRAMYRCSLGLIRSLSDEREVLLEGSIEALSQLLRLLLTDRAIIAEARLRIMIWQAVARYFASGHPVLRTALQEPEWSWSHSQLATLGQNTRRWSHGQLNAIVWPEIKVVPERVSRGADLSASGAHTYYYDPASGRRERMEVYPGYWVIHRVPWVEVILARKHPFYW